MRPRRGMTVKAPSVSPEHVPPRTCHRLTTAVRGARDIRILREDMIVKRRDAVLALLGDPSGSSVTITTRSWPS